MMDLDNFTKLYIIQADGARFFKFQVFASHDLRRKMAIGTIAFDEDEAKRLFHGLQAVFENRQLPDWISIKDLRNMQKANQDYRIKQEDAMRAPPVSAQDIQEQNLKAEGRLEPQELGNVAEIKRKIEVD